MTRLRILVPALAGLATLALTACGGGGGSLTAPSIAPARQYHLSGFRPVGPVRPGKPTEIAFTVVQPNGQPLTDYQTGPGPHTGVHLIVVRKDLSTIMQSTRRSGLAGVSARRSRSPSPGHTACSSTSTRRTRARNTSTSSSPRA